MLVGDLVALPAAVGLSVVFGAMELMLPVMVSGMLSGMVVGMRAASGPPSNGTALTWGAALGPRGAAGDLRPQRVCPGGTYRRRAT